MLDGSCLKHLTCKALAPSSIYITHQCAPLTTCLPHPPPLVPCFHPSSTPAPPQPPRPAPPHAPRTPSGLAAPQRAAHAEALRSGRVDAEPLARQADGAALVAVHGACQVSVGGGFRVEAGGGAGGAVRRSRRGWMYEWPNKGRNKGLGSASGHFMCTPIGHKKDPNSEYLLQTGLKFGMGVAAFNVANEARFPPLP